MTPSDFHGKPQVPDAVKHLDADVVVEVLSRHAVNISEAADELGVASADLRRLLWARPHLVEAAAEIEERRLDLAEKNIFEALKSEDPRRRDAASMFTLRNSARAKRRGWITSSSAGVDVNVCVNTQPHRYVFRWRTAEDDERDKAEADLEALKLKAEAARLIEHNPGLAAAEEPPEENDGWRPPTYG